MRARTVGIFALGFATGALFLAVALWYSGSLNPVAVSAGNLQDPRKKDPRKKVVMPLPPATGEVQPEPSHEEAGATGTMPQLAMPIEGVQAKDVPATFDSARDGRKHEALDIMAARGTPVHAAAEGNVVKLFHSKPGGLTVYQFDDTNTWCYYYAHLDRYAPGLKEGTLLRKGDVLGYVGSTGNASGGQPHLHFAVNQLGADKKWWGGTPVDPLPMLRAGSSAQ